MTGHATPITIDAETEKIVREIGIPPCPKIVLEFMQEMRKDDPNMRKLTDLIGSDPGLASAVLKMANSSMFGLKSKVSTIQNAFSVLGMRAASMLVSSLLLKRSFPVSQSKLIESFWRNSAGTATYAAALAPTFVQIDRHVAYTYGLFRDCGQAVMLVNYPDYDGIFTGAQVPAGATVTSVEMQKYPVNHASIGAVLSTSWYLSDVICEAILQHHEIADIFAARVKPSLGAARLIAIGLLADQIQSLHQASAPHREWDSAKAFVGATLGISAAGLENVGSMIDRTELAVTA